MSIINEYRFDTQEGTTLVDYQGNNNGTITGADWIVDLDGSKKRFALDFISTNSDYVDCGDLGNIKSLVIVCKLDSTTENILQNNTNGLSASGGTLSYTDFDNAYVDSVDTNTIDADDWHCITLTSTTDVACTNFELGRISTTYGDLKIAYVMTDSDVLTEAEIKAITERELLRINKRPLLNRIKNVIDVEPVAHYPLNGNSNDISGNGHNGTDTSMTYGSKWDDGLDVGEFDGGYISLSQGFKGSQTKWSYSFWFTTNTPATEQRTTFNDSVDDYFLMMKIVLSKLCLYYVDTPGEKRITGTTTLIAGQQYFATYIIDTTGTCYLYLDGKLEGSVVVDGNRWSGLEAGNNIGAARDNTTKWNGKIWDFRVFPSALSHAQVKQLYRTYSPPKNDIQDGLELYIPLNGNSADNSGNGHNGTDTSMSYTTIAADGNPVGSFNGTTSKIAIIDDTDLKPTGAFTVSAWVKASDTAALGVVFASGNQTSSERGFICRIYVNHINFRLAGGAVVNTTGATVLANDTWYFLTYIYDGSNAKVYVNGKLDGTTSASGFAPIYHTPNYPVVGAWTADHYGTIQYLDGSISDLRFYNGEALTPAEIDKLYRDTYIS